MKKINNLKIYSLIIFTLILIINLNLVIAPPGDDSNDESQDNVFGDDSSTNYGLSDTGEITDSTKFNTYVGDNYPGLSGSNFEGGSFDSGTGIYTGADGSTLDMNQFKDSTKKYKITSSKDGITITNPEGKKHTYEKVKNIKKNEDGSFSFEEAGKTNPDENTEATDVIGGEEQEDGSYSYVEVGAYKTESIFVTKGSDVSYDALTDTLTIEHADSIIVNNLDILTDVNKFSSDPTYFKIKFAENVMFKSKNGFITLFNVSDTTFRSNQVVELTADNKINYNIIDYYDNLINFDSDLGGILIISKNTTLPEYTVKESTIRLGNETLTKNATVIVDDANGFVCMQLGDYGEYNTTEYRFIKPQDGFYYKLCLKKGIEQNFKLENCVNILTTISKQE